LISKVFSPVDLVLNSPMSKKVIPLLILVLGCLASVIAYFFDIVFGPKNLAALIAVVLCVIAFFKFRFAYKYLLFTTLLLGLFGFINFLPIDFGFSFRFGEVGLGFSPFVLLVGILTYFLNPQESDRFIRHLVGTTS